MTDTRRCAHCQRTLTPRSEAGQEGQPAYCHRSVSPDCYKAYRKWRYKHDAAYRAGRLAYNRAWKQGKRGGS